MTWAMVGSAGVGAVGNIIAGNGGSGRSRPYMQVPEHLRGAWENLGGQIEGMEVPEYYQGQLVADQNAAMQQSLGDMSGWGQEGGAGYDAMSAMMSGAQPLMGAGQMGMDYLQGMQDRGPNQFQYDQGTYDQSFNNLSSGLQGMYDNTTGQMQQGFEWGGLKGLNMQNALSGGQGSSKLYQDSALGQAMVDQNKMNFGADMWQNAANQANQGAMSAGSQNLQSANAFDQNMVSNYGNMQQLGNQMMGTGFDMGISNMGMGLKSGQLQQAYDQSVIDADKAKWDFEQAAPMAHLNQQLNMLNGQKMTGGSPGTPGANPFDLAIQGAQTGLGIYGAGKDAGWWGGGQGDWGYDPFLNTGDQPGDAGYIDF